MLVSIAGAEATFSSGRGLFEDPSAGTTRDVYEIDEIPLVCVNNSQPSSRLSLSGALTVLNPLQKEPARRSSAQESLTHPWVLNEAGAANLPLGGSVVQVGDLVVHT